VFAQVALWRDENGCAVKSASLALDDADHHVDPELGSEAGKLVDCRSRDVDGALPVPPEMIAAFRSAVADHRPERDASRVARDESFGKQHEASSAGGRLAG